MGVCRSTRKGQNDLEREERQSERERHGQYYTHPHRETVEGIQVVGDVVADG